MYSKYFNITIIPKLVFYKSKLLKIVKVDDSLIIKGFKVYVDDKQRIKKVTISSHHPNAINKDDVRDVTEKASSNTELCLNNSIKDMPMEPKIIKKIIALLEVYNYDSCYWTDWYYIDVEEKAPFKHRESTSHVSSNNDVTLKNIIMDVGSEIGSTTLKILSGVFKNVHTKRGRRKSSKRTIHPDS